MISGPFLNEFWKLFWCRLSLLHRSYDFRRLEVIVHGFLHLRVTAVEANVQISRLTKWLKDYSLSIGKSPLVKLNRVTKDCQATVLAKVEGRNPAFSVKCRLGAALIWDAEERGVLKPGITVVEPTSG